MPLDISPQVAHSLTPCPSISSLNMTNHLLTVPSPVLFALYSSAYKTRDMHCADIMYRWALGKSKHICVSLCEKSTEINPHLPEFRGIGGYYSFFDCLGEKCGMGQVKRDHYEFFR